jgi:hypothetical protein
MTSIIKHCIPTAHTNSIQPIGQGTSASLFPTMHNPRLLCFPNIKTMLNVFGGIDDVQYMKYIKPTNN